MIATKSCFFFWCLLYDRHCCKYSKIISFNVPATLQDKYNHCPHSQMPNLGEVFKKLCDRAVFNSNGLALPGEENGNPLQYSCLENSTDRGA